LEVTKVVQKVIREGVWLTGVSGKVWERRKLNRVGNEGLEKRLAGILDRRNRQGDGTRSYLEKKSASRNAWHEHFGI
jgi:hypothetical protein